MYPHAAARFYESEGLLARVIMSQLQHELGMLPSNLCKRQNKLISFEILRLSSLVGNGRELECHLQKTLKRLRTDLLIAKRIDVFL